MKENKSINPGRINFRIVKESGNDYLIEVQDKNFPVEGYKQIEEIDDPLFNEFCELWDFCLFKPDPECFYTEEKIRLFCVSLGMTEDVNLNNTVDGYNVVTLSIDPENTIFCLTLEDDDHYTTYLQVFHKNYHNVDVPDEIREVNHELFQKYFDNSFENGFELSEEGVKFLDNPEKIKQFCTSIGMVEDNSLND